MINCLPLLFCLRTFAVSLLIVAVIVLGCWRLLRESLNLALAAVPKNINQDGIRSYPSSLPKVLEVHDHHILAMSTAETVRSAHLVICEADLASVTKQLDKVAHELEAHFHIAHPTIQIKHACHLASEAVI